MTDGNEWGDLFDAIGNPETDHEAEHVLIGSLLWHPEWLTDEIKQIVQPELLHYRELGRVLAGMIEADGFTPENDALISWLGGGDAARAALGTLRGIGADVSADELTEAALSISETGVRRLEAAPMSEVYLDDGFQSRMGLLMWSDQVSHVQAEYDYVIEDTIPEKQLVIVMGATQAGKSFLSFHMAMCIARGVPFFGRRILEPEPVIWGAWEGGAGARGRMLAYAKHHGIDSTAEIPFAALTNPFDLWSKEENVDALLKECHGIIRTRFNGKKPAALFIDTHNAATPGASEIDSEAVSRIRDRYRKISADLGCAVIIIGHTNALGKHRGNELLVNNVDTVITVTLKTNVKGRVPVQIRDEDRRDVRTVQLWKQREGETGHMFDFVLPAIETGIKNKFGKSRTSCVVVTPNWSAAAEQDANDPRPENARVGIKLSDHDDHFFKCVWKALGEAGEPAPPELKLPTNRVVVHRLTVRRIFEKSLVPEDGQSLAPGTVRSRWSRCSDRLRRQGVIGFEEPFFYWTGKKVMGVRGTFAQSEMFDAAPVASSIADEFPETE